MITMILAAVIFFGTYVVIASEKVHKTTAALLGSTLMLLFILPGPGHDDTGGDTERQLESIRQKLESSQPTEAQLRAIHAVERSAERYSKLDVYSRYANFDVIFTLAGMMVLVNILSGTGLFQYIAIKCAKIARGSPVRTLILLVLATALLSAFLDNVTTVLLVAPVSLVVAAQMSLPALPFLMAETLASNIGGTATLIGDPPNLIIGSVAEFNFMAFIINLSPFVVLVTSIYCIFLWLYYNPRMKVSALQRAKIMELDEKSAISDPANLKRGAIVMGLTIVGFLLHGAFHLQPSVVAMTGAAAALLICRVDVEHELERIEWSTLFFFMGLFILVSGADFAGLMKFFSEGMAVFSDWPVPLTVIAIMWISALAAAIMNNVSFTAAMTAITASFIAATPQFRDNPVNQDLLWWGLALAVCFGGNGTMVGAAANLVVAGIAEKAGAKISFTTFLRYSIPVTIGTMILASLYVIARYYALKS